MRKWLIYTIWSSEPLGSLQIDIASLSTKLACVRYSSLSNFSQLALSSDLAAASESLLMHSSTKAFFCVKLIKTSRLKNFAQFCQVKCQCWQNESTMLIFFIFISCSKTMHIASFLFSESCFSAAQIAKSSLLALTVASLDNHRPENGHKLDGTTNSCQGLNMFRWRPGQEASLAPPLWDGTTNLHRLNPPKLLKLPKLLAWPGNLYGSSWSRFISELYTNFNNGNIKNKRD